MSAELASTEKCVLGYTLLRNLFVALKAEIYAECFRIMRKDYVFS